MFIGEYVVKIDNNGRVGLPAGFRKELVRTFKDERIVITNAFPCDLGNGEIGKGIAIYPYRIWLDLAKRFEQRVDFDERHRKSINRFIFEKAKICVADSRGRITISYFLRNIAGLTDKVVFAGCIEKIELWNQSTWKKIERNKAIDFPY